MNSGDSNKTDFEKLQPSTQKHLIDWFCDYSHSEAVVDLLHMIPTEGLHKVLRDIADQMEEQHGKDWAESQDD